VVHSRDEEKAAGVLHLIHAAVRRSHFFVVSECVERRKNGIACAVIEDDFAAVAEERAQIRPRRIRQGLVFVGLDIGNHLVDVQIGRRHHGSNGIGPVARQEARERTGAAKDVSGVVRPRGIDLIPSRIFRTSEGFLQGSHLLRTQARIRLGPRARENGGIEMAGF